MIEIIVPHGTYPDKIYRPALEKFIGEQHIDWDWDMDPLYHGNLIITIFDDSKEDSVFLFHLMISQ